MRFSFNPNSFFSRLVIMAKSSITRQRAFISKGNRLGDLNGWNWFNPEIQPRFAPHTYVWDFEEYTFYFRSLRSSGSAVWVRVEQMMWDDWPLRNDNRPKTIQWVRCHRCCWFTSVWKGWNSTRTHDSEILTSRYFCHRILGKRSRAKSLVWRVFIRRQYCWSFTCSQALPSSWQWHGLANRQELWRVGSKVKKVYSITTWHAITPLHHIPSGASR